MPPPSRAISSSAPARAAAATPSRPMGLVDEEARDPPIRQVVEAVEVRLPVLDPRQLVRHAELAPAHAVRPVEHERGVGPILHDAQLLLRPVQLCALAPPLSLGVKAHAPAAAPHAVVGFHQPGEVGPGLRRERLGRVGRHARRRYAAGDTTWEDAPDGPPSAPRRRHLRAVPVPLLARQQGPGARRHPRGGRVVPHAARAGRHPRRRGHRPRHRVVPQRPLGRVQGRLRHRPRPAEPVQRGRGRAAGRGLPGVGDGRAGGRRRAGGGRQGRGGGRPRGAGRHLHAGQGPRPMRRRQGLAVGPPPGQVVRRQPGCASASA